eukprot:m.308630 g.308630  ORF g.308630 m.308630 type:complete len:372 (+) comp44393_c0_seq1:95-1210(+)
MKSTLLSLLLLALVALSQSSVPFYMNGPRCEVLQRGFARCEAHGYNLTLMPNDLGHRSQREALEGFVAFGQLLNSGCSDELEFFLCTLHATPCTDAGGFVFGIGPCRDLCERVRGKCRSVMAQFVKWEASYGGKLKCSRFPKKDNTDGHFCVSQSPQNADPPTMMDTEEPTTEEAAVTTEAAVTEVATRIVTTQASKPETSAPKEEATPTSPPKTAGRKCPKCPRKVRGTYNNFIKGKYDYVIRGEVRGRTTNKGIKVYRFELHQIYNQTNVDLTKSVKKVMELWTRSKTKCVCPKLKRGQHYIIAGHEDKKKTELLLTKKTLFEPWDRNMEISVSRWFQRATRLIGPFMSNVIPPLKKMKKGTRKTFRKE